MAVYTEVADNDLITFMSGYALGDVLSFKGIAEGVENTNYLVHTETGYFILTLYEKRVRREDLPFFLGLMEHLSARGITCPTPIHDRSGAVLRELAGRPAAVMSFLEGMWPKRPTPAHCRALGGALARFHLAAADYDGARANALSVADWRALIEPAGAAADTQWPGITAEVLADLSAIETAWPDDLPRGIVHADLFPDNVFFLGDRLSGIIDFYFACRDMLGYDIAICLNAWCFEPDLSFNITKARALMAGYRAVRPLEDREIAALPALARGAAMRFFATRLVDWINHPPGAFVKPHDPIAYLKRLRFHRSATRPEDYGVL